MSPVVAHGLAHISLEDPEHMRTLAEQAAEDLADASAEEVIRWAVDTFGDRICVTSSMTDAVIIHLASAVHPGIDVVFLDTGYHFAETIGTRDAVEAVYPIRLVNVTPSRTVAEQDAELGPRLFGRNPDLCCYLRKVEPLERALTNYDAWITGVRRDETNNRRQSRVVEWDDRREMVKVNPIVSWTQKQVDDFITTNGVLVNPLVYDGYPSIGCATCTARVERGRGPAQRPVGGNRQDGVRHPCLNRPKNPKKSSLPSRTAARTRVPRPPSRNWRWWPGSGRPGWTCAPPSWATPRRRCRRS